MRIVKCLLILLVCVYIFGCSEGPVGPQGEKGDKGAIYINPNQLTTWGYSITASDVLKKKGDIYTVIIYDSHFLLGYWYDVWIVGIDAQFRVDMFIIEPGLLSFNYIFDPTGYALLIITSKGDDK